MFPTAEMKVVWEFLRDPSTHHYKDVVKAVLAILNWASDFLPDPGPTPVFAQVNLTDAEVADQLEAFCQTGGVVAAGAPTGVPVWLIPVLMMILKRLLGV